MEISGLHLLLTYQCTFECDHCFVWGSPFQSGTMTLRDIEVVLKQGRDLGTVESIYYEGGEPFLYYPVLVEGVKLAAQMGFEVGIVSNAYWATSVEDAITWLKPFQGLIEDLSVSSDLYHYDEKLSVQAQNAEAAAERLGIPIGLLSVAQPEALNSEHAIGQLPIGESGIMYRGRAAKKLAGQAIKQPWQGFNECPYEDLRDPGRVHVDPLGNLHICQGISLGNLFETPLEEIISEYDPKSHPITSHLLEGGPRKLIEFYRLAHEENYADACHLCYEARQSLRPLFPDVLTPDQMYGLY
jgi:MoaA/NifB/PqqE/SkfB family radical SAM enzyme